MRHRARLPGGPRGSVQALHVAWRRLRTRSSDRKRRGVVAASSLVQRAQERHRRRDAVCARRASAERVGAGQGSGLSLGDRGLALYGRSPPLSVTPLSACLPVAPGGFYCPQRLPALGPGLPAPREPACRPAHCHLARGVFVVEDVACAASPRVPLPVRASKAAVLRAGTPAAGRSLCLNSEDALGCDM